MNDEVLQVERYVAEKVRVVLAAARIPLGTVRVQSQMHDYGFMISTAVHGVFLSREVSRTTESEWVPEDWWDALRDRWSPRWVLRRWPIRRRQIIKSTVVHRLCPHMETPQDRYVHFQFLAGWPKSDWL